jgi:hypothetical protein
MGEWMYRSTFSWPRHKLEVSGELRAPAALPPGKEPPLEGWVGPRAGLDDLENFLSYRDSKSHPSVVQAVVSRYTDYAIPAPNHRCENFEYGYVLRTLH